MKIVAVSNIKGGVGKTTAAVNLAYLCAASGRPTLLWDLDPQGAAGYTLRCEPAAKVSAKKLVSGKVTLNEVLVASHYARLDVLPADFSYRNFDLHLGDRKHPTERLLRMSRVLRDVYDVLFLDCPAGISLLSETVLRATDAVVVPMIPTPLSQRTLAQLHEFVREKQWNDLQLLPFFSMVDRRRGLHREVMASTRAEFPGMLSTEVPYWSEIERMSLVRAPLAAYAPRSAGAQIYAALWGEIESRLGHIPAARTLAPEALADPAATPASTATDMPGDGGPPPPSLEPPRSELTVSDNTDFPPFSCPNEISSVLQAERR